MTPVPKGLGDKSDDEYNGATAITKASTYSRISVLVPTNSPPSSCEIALAIRERDRSSPFPLPDK